jgi:hypothetical protein
LRHAVSAPEVAPVRDGDPQITQTPVKTIEHPPRLQSRAVIQRVRLFAIRKDRAGRGPR